MIQRLLPTLLPGLLLFAAIGLAALLPSGNAMAQVTQVAEPSPVVERPVIPAFIDPNFRPTRPDLSALTRLRFLTVTDFAPFSFIDSANRLTGFHVDLARDICTTLDVLERCQIQALPLAEVEAALLAGNAEALLAGLRPTPARRRRLAFSQPYFRLPARFVVEATSELAGWSEGAVPFVEQLGEREIGVIDATAHAAFAKAWFGTVRLRLFVDAEAALKALRAGKIAAIFGDGVAFSAFMQETGPRALSFAGPPYFSLPYFGTGLAVAVARDDETLQQAIDYALADIFRDGRFAELYLRYFPVGVF